MIPHDCLAVFYVGTSMSKYNRMAIYILLIYFKNTLHFPYIAMTRLKVYKKYVLILLLENNQNALNVLLVLFLKVLQCFSTICVGNLIAYWFADLLPFVW